MDEWNAEKPMPGETVYDVTAKANDKAQGFAGGWMAGIAWARRQK